MPFFVSQKLITVFLVGVGWMCCDFFSSWEYRFSRIRTMAQRVPRYPPYGGSSAAGCAAMPEPRAANATTVEELARQFQAAGLAATIASTTAKPLPSLLERPHPKLFVDVLQWLQAAETGPPDAAAQSTAPRVFIGRLLTNVNVKNVNKCYFFN